MGITKFQHILPFVERPSRYLGTEINRIKKDPKKIKLRFALAFPDLYEIGMSHFGLQILYHILNQEKDIAAERVFAPSDDLAELLRSKKFLLRTLESSYPLCRFDIIGFSLLYELNYTNILTILDLAGIPFYAELRNTSHPLVIAGGPCTCNPEPVADIFDALVIGDGEKVVLEMARSWIEWKKVLPLKKEKLLESWAAIEGVYVPRFFTPAYDASGFQILSSGPKVQKNIKRTIIGDLNLASFPNAPIVPYGRPVHDRLRLELARGCTRGCRFCQAGMIYRPVRERSPEHLLELTKSSLLATGYEDLSLLSLSTGDYTCIQPLIERLMNCWESENIAVSLPSLRAGSLTPRLINQIKRVRKTGFTIAPEAGSQRLRDVINKNISKQEILEAVTNAFRLGWKVIKLYFMIGLPTETDSDLQAIVNLVKELRQVKKSIKASGSINVSVTTFIPKPHTPFQWAPQLSLESSREKILWLKTELDLPAVRFKWQNPEVSYLEGVWSRGDRRLSPLLALAHEKGCRFDGWSDHFRYDLWQQTFAETGIDPDFFTVRHRSLDEPLPWEHIDIRVTKEYLKNEYKNAFTQKSTPDCRRHPCNSCGACDFKQIAPVIFKQCKRNEPIREEQKNDLLYKTFKVTFAKRNQARFFGHLELLNIFQRALRRAKIPVKYSKGFHPMPKMSFADPLPLGTESINEIMYLTVPVTVTPDDVVLGLNRQLPDGLAVKSCQPAPVKSARLKPESVTYQITLIDGFFDQNAIKYFLKSTAAVITRLNKKGRKIKFDLKPEVIHLELKAPNRLRITLRQGSNHTIRPTEALAKIFSLSEKALKQSRIMKL